MNTHRDCVSEGLHPVVLQDHVLVLHGHTQLAQCVCVTQWKITGSIFICNEFCFGILTFQRYISKTSLECKKISTLRYVIPVYRNSRERSSECVFPQSKQALNKTNYLSCDTVRHSTHTEHSVLYRLF
jgi:hypothetical protein